MACRPTGGGLAGWLAAEVTAPSHQALGQGPRWVTRPIRAPHGEEAGGEQEGESMSSRLTHFCPLPATVVLAESTPVYIVMMLWTLLAK